MAFEIKRHDASPVLRRVLLDGNGVPINLTTATGVNFVMAPKSALPDDPPALKKAAFINDPVAGDVEYRWVVADTTVAGDFNGEFEIVWGDGTPQTVPTHGYIDITINDDLG